MKRTATAEWRGGLKDGKGEISTQSGVLAKAQYSFGTRFDQGIGTNPEELIAAAHAGCFAMALSMILGEAKTPAERIHVTATVSLENVETGWTITESHLELKAKVPGADKESFDTAAKKAKAGCPVSRLLTAKVTLDATLET